MKKYKINISEERHCRDLEGLGSIFVPIMRNVLTSEDLVGVDIILNWRDIVGNEMALYCNPRKTKYNPRECKRTLFLEVPVGGFALEIQHKESYILEKINAYFGYRAVHRLSINQNMNMRPYMKARKQSADKEQSLSEDDEKYLAVISEEIKDENLRKILIKIGKNVILAGRSSVKNDNN